MIQSIPGNIAYSERKDIKRHKPQAFAAAKSICANKKLAHPDAGLLKAYYLNSANNLKFTGYYSNSQEPQFRICNGEGNLTQEEAMKIAALVDNYSGPTDDVKLLGAGFLGQCFKIKLPTQTPDGFKIVAVKVAKPYGEIKQLNQRDTSFHNEAKNLSYVPTSVKDAQHLIARFKLNGKYYLVSDFKEGVPLNKFEGRLSPQQLENLISSLEGLDKAGLINYDLNPGSLIVDKDSVGIIDFEFSEKFDPLKQMNSMPPDLFNTSFNLAFFKKSNISSFEMRSLAEYLDNISESKGPEEAREALKDYLKALSKYNTNMAKFYDEYYNTLPQSKFGYGYGDSGYGYCSETLSRSTVSRAENLEKTFHNIYSNPTPEILDIERLRIKIKYTMLDYYLSKDRLGTRDEKPGDREKYGSEYRVHDKIKPMIAEIYSKLEKLHSRARSLKSEDALMDGYKKIDIDNYHENYMNYLYSFAHQELHCDLGQLTSNYSDSEQAA